MPSDEWLVQQRAFLAARDKIGIKTRLEAEGRKNQARNLATTSTGDTSHLVEDLQKVAEDLTACGWKQQGTYVQKILRSLTHHGYFVDIPRALHLTTFRFILIGKQDKRPIETAWTSEKNYSFRDARLRTHLAQGGNYGIICGPSHLVVVDIDAPSWVERIKDQLPETLMVKTGGGGIHLYYLSRGYGKKTIFFDPADDSHLGEVQSGHADTARQRTQVVGPWCVHPNGNRYSLEHDATIARISPEDLRAGLLKAGVVFSSNAALVKAVPTATIPKLAVRLSPGQDLPRSMSETLARFGLAPDENSKIPCPFHGDTKSSLHVYDDHGHCFGCEWHGGPRKFYFDLIRLQQGGN